MQQYSLDSVWQSGLSFIEQLLMTSEYAVFAKLKIKFFPSKKRVGRPIAKYSSLQHVLNVSQLLEISRQNLRF